MKDNSGWLQAVLASAIASISAWVVGRWTGLAILGIALLITWVIARFTLKRIPGLTGDIYGAINEVIEIVVLLSWIVIQYLAEG